MSRQTFKVMVQIGEILIGSDTDDIKTCSKQATELVSNPKIMKYLKLEQKQERLKNSYLG